MLEGVVIDDTKFFSWKLQEWEDFYNYNRPHGALGGQTPYERLRRRPRPRLSAVSVSCTASGLVFRMRLP